MPSLTAPVGPGNSSKAPPKKPLIGQKKPMEAPGSSPPSRCCHLLRSTKLLVKILDHIILLFSNEFSLTYSNSKKQKVSGSFVDQSIEHLNDVTAVSGVNLRVTVLQHHHHT